MVKDFVLKIVFGMLLIMVIIGFSSGLESNPQRSWNYLGFYYLNNATYLNATEDVCIHDGTCLGDLTPSSDVVHNKLGVTGGASYSGSSTCALIYSPNGVTRLEVCN